jgi:hypothetical protein
MTYVNNKKERVKNNLKVIEKENPPNPYTLTHHSNNGI